MDTFLRHENETDNGFPFKLGEEVDVQIDAGKATLIVHSVATKKVERGTSKIGDGFDREFVGKEAWCLVGYSLTGEVSRHVFWVRNMGVFEPSVPRLFWVKKEGCFMGGKAPKTKPWHILGFSEYLLICACSSSFKESSVSIPEKRKIFWRGKKQDAATFRSAGHPGIGGVGGGLFHP